MTAQKANQTGVSHEGRIGVLGDKPAEDVPFAVKSYNSALILNQQPQTLGQVLENDPSVRTSYGFGNAAEQFVIRGFALAGDDIGFDGLYGITPRQLIAPELYESVQVLNGSSAFLNGAAPGGTGIGGSVNLIPKRAGAKPLTRLTANYTSSEHFGGSFDFARRFGSGGEWGVRINGAARRGDVGIDDEFRSAYLLGGAIDYDSGPLRLSLDLAYQKVRVNQLRPKLTLPAAITVIPRVPDAKTNYGQPYYFTNLRDIYGQFRAEHDLSDNAMVYAALGARDGSEDGFYSTLSLLNATTGAASVSGSRIPRTDNNEAAQAGIRVKLASGGITHEFNFGGSMNWLVNRNAFEFYAISSGTNKIYNPVVVPRPSTITSRGGNMADPFPISRTRLLSTFASDTIGILDDRILLTAGLRLQQIHVKTYAASAIPARNIPAGGLSAEYRKDAITPVVGLVVKPVDGVSLYANRIEALVQGAQAPAVSGGFNIINVGEVLPPYKSTQYEVGGKLTLSKVTASLSFFTTDRATQILELVPAPPANSARFVASGLQRNRGIELSIQAEPIEGLRIITGGSVIDSELRRQTNGLNEGNKVAGVPDYLVNGNVEWDLPFIPALTLTGRVVHTGEQQANNANTLHLPSWTRLDLGARYVALIGDNPLTLRFSVDNVANKRYWATAFDSSRPDLLQGAPRTYKLSASIDL
ncbi:iron complex outermembrane receptor protein [Novosphingobium chloroacetimidivorans]|uniref:Iron complex outermembrane receptor protein n=1 Tax=Novosphingobium chloroacetimidivorans TaxID=1428314 RepID=A0A7W7KAN3_9SPHN|nr:TonB-dependent siderophore receptor [Novosphingobium chloroacetimidivorans]MBB4859286.1 iron complex outermembrane receptor protein [Novosphingobium chloroacetimidivorans]